MEARLKVDVLEEATRYDFFFGSICLITLLFILFVTTNIGGLLLHIECCFWV